MGKILLFVAIIFTLLTAALGFMNHQTLAQKAAALAEAEGNLQSTKTKLTAKEGELKKKSEELTAAVTEKEQLASASAGAKSDLSSVTAKVSDLTAQVTAKQTELDTAKSDLDAAQKKIAELQTAPPAPAAAAGNPEDAQKLAEQKALTDALQTKLASRETELENLRKEKEQRSKGQMRSGLEGRILAVNPSWNFVVLNLGDRNGVLNNAEMLVKRGAQLVGKVRITSVEPSSSIADIVSNSVPHGLTIQPGDNVIYQNSEE